MKLIFALPCVKICQIIRQKRVSWKTRLLTDRIKFGSLQYRHYLSIPHSVKNYFSHWLCFTRISKSENNKMAIQEVFSTVMFSICEFPDVHTRHLNFHLSGKYIVFWLHVNFQFFHIKLEHQRKTKWQCSQYFDLNLTCSFNSIETDYQWALLNIEMESNNRNELHSSLVFSKFTYSR